MCLMDKASSILSLVLEYQQLICVMPRDPQGKYVAFQEAMHGADRRNMASTAGRNDYWEMKVWKGNLCSVELNGTGDP